MADPLPDPFRLRVLKAISGALAEITPANGWRADLGGDGTQAQRSRGHVARGRIAFGDDEPLPLVSVLEPPIPLDVLLITGDNTSSSGDWELLVQGFVVDDEQNPSDPAHQLMAEVKMRLITEQRRDNGNNKLGMKGKVMEMNIGQGAVRPADETSSKCFFWLILRLKLVEDLSNPYE